MKVGYGENENLNYFFVEKNKIIRFNCMSIHSEFAMQRNQRSKCVNRNQEEHSLKQICRAFVKTKQKTILYHV
jgi:hypothetical protein